MPRPVRRARLHVLLRGGDGGEDERDLAAEHVERRLSAALVGDVFERDAGAALEHLAGQMRRRAGARGAERPRRRAGFRQGEELGQRLRGHGRMRHEQQSCVAELGDRREVAQRVERQLRDQVRIDDQRAVEAEQQRVAVGRRRGHRLRADGAAGAGPVVDDHLLAEPRAERVGDGAHAAVGEAAGRVGHDDADRPVRERRLRDGRRRGGGQGERRGGGLEEGWDHGAGSGGMVRRVIPIRGDPRGVAVAWCAVLPRHPGTRQARPCRTRAPRGCCAIRRCVATRRPCRCRRPRRACTTVPTSRATVTPRRAALRRRRARDPAHRQPPPLQTSRVACRVAARAVAPAGDDPAPCPYPRRLRTCACMASTTALSTRSPLPTPKRSRNAATAPRLRLPWRPSMPPGSMPRYVR